uniref:Transposase n=1 Tax=Heterorhabditis bacteriophora TaxID=37862 RepID=A0A1I7WYP2_HETBA
MSVKRKAARINTGMKLVGIKAVDDQFKSAVTPLAESIAMRNKLEAAMIDWQEECGLGPAGTIRQGIRLIHSRMITLAVNLYYIFKILVIYIRRQNNFERIKIEDSIRLISDSHDELTHLCQESGLKGQKATRAAENFTWNLRQVFDTGGVLGILSDKLMSRRNCRRFSRVIPDPSRDSAL